MWGRWSQDRHGQMSKNQIEKETDGCEADGHLANRYGTDEQETNG